MSIGRPSIEPPPGWVSLKPSPSARSFGTIRIDSPRWPFERSGSVLAISIRMSALAANVHQVLTPLMSQPLPSGVAVAVTFTPATSEP